MKKLLLTPFILFPFFAVAQIHFSIKIIFDLNHIPNNIIVAQSGERKFDTLLYPQNNVLEYKGQITNPGTFSIKTDSSNPIQIWVDDTPISFTCNEERTKTNYIKLAIANLEGSADTKLLYQMTIPKTDTFRFGPEVTPKQADSIGKTYRYNYVYKLIDSLFITMPRSPILPFYLNYYKPVLGSGIIGAFYNKLPENVQISDQGLSVKKYLDRSALLQPGGIFGNFDMRNQKRKKFSLSSVSAKFILIDFWASWCGPCRSENPHLVKLYEQYRQKGFEIISVSLDENKDAWLNAIKKDNLNWYHVSDLRRWNNKLAEKYKISAIPFTVLLDSNYKIIALPSHTGELQKILTEILK